MPKCPQCKRTVRKRELREANGQLACAECRKPKLVKTEPPEHQVVHLRVWNTDKVELTVESKPFHLHLDADLKKIKEFLRGA